MSRFREEQAVRTGAATLKEARAQAARLMEEYADTMEDRSEEATSDREMVAYREAATALQAWAQKLREDTP